VPSTYQYPLRIQTPQKCYLLFLDPALVNAANLCSQFKEQLNTINMSDSHGVTTPLGLKLDMEYGWIDLAWQDADVEYQPRPLAGDNSGPNMNNIFGCVNRRALDGPAMINLEDDDCTAHVLVRDTQKQYMPLFGGLHTNESYFLRRASVDLVCGIVNFMELIVCPHDTTKPGTYMRLARTDTGRGWKLTPDNPSPMLTPPGTLVTERLAINMLEKLEPHLPLSGTRAFPTTWSVPEVAL
jgi:hypothetical protein